MFRLTTAAALTAACMATTAYGQARACGDRDVVVARLASQYGETRQSMGLGANNQIVEVFASVETGTWTITVTNAQGRMCLVASGQAYEAVAPEPAGLRL